MQKTNVIQAMLLLLAMIGFGALPALAQGSGPEYQLITEPTVITAPGNYRLGNNLILDEAQNNLEAAIVIRSSYVTLDLGGYLIRGANGGQSGTGILVDGVIGTEVRNGSVAMFAFNVVVRNSANAIITGLRIRGNDLVPVAPPPEVGIMVAQSRNITIRENNIYNVGLGVFVRGGNSWGNRTTANTITAGRNGVLGVCYNPTPDDPRGPTGDLIDNNLISSFDVAVQMSANSVSNIIRDNTLAFVRMAIDLQNFNNLSVNNSQFRMLDFGSRR
ncbi:MAG: right-handed parallel beta-helix repeat-containing protein [Bryobacterales bacterium]|jgi:hypothetical protein|nr:right-handed parallel beta-helix repeat-containing protein [Bryobacterales bacterium]